ncbi:LysR substrate-binding protein [Burkholderia sp. BT03]|nr:LysR substrate-binding protein [Burkholderia sp. BT03]
MVQGFDAGIRLMETVPQDVIAVPFGDRQRFGVVGSGEYFTQHKPPRAPADLSAHRCIRRRMPSGSIDQSKFERHGETVRIDGNGPLTLDDPGLMLAAMRAGLGLRT